MDNVLKTDFMIQMVRTISNMYRLGWDERNGGNISLLLDDEEVPEGIKGSPVRTMVLNFDAHELAGRYVLVTGTGKYFKNVEIDPAANLGIVRISKDGLNAELVWGFTDGGTFTSEFPAHLMSHIVRHNIDPTHKVVLHCHPVNTLAMTFIHSLDEKEFTRTLWQMCTESMVVFPDGVNVLPWMLSGTNEIGIATAEKMKTARIVVWAQHGIYGVGKDLDEAFGLVETVEKAAEIYMKIAHLPRLNTITDEQLHLIEKRYGVKGREGYLS